MKRVVFVYGGKSVENEISILTCLKAYREFNKINKDVYLVYLDHQGNFYGGKGLTALENYPLKNGFKKVSFIKENERYYIKYPFRKIEFDLVLILGHGKNAEDGALSSYFETLNIPYCYDDISNVSLFLDKVKTKYVFNSLGVRQTKFIKLHRFEYKNDENPSFDFSYPVIVKPSRLGSSIGINKANNYIELHEAITRSFMYDDTIVIEEFIENKIEYNIALLGYGNKMITSSIEEVNHGNEVLSFYDKYDYSKGNEKRIICPLIDRCIKDEIELISKNIFTTLNLCGIYRFDFIYDVDGKTLYLNEVNSLPGSLSYYLFEEKGITMSDLILMYIDFHLERRKNNDRLLSTFQEGFASKVISDKFCS